MEIRNFRIYYYGQLASVCGTWMQSVALAWVVLERTGSASSVGLLVAFEFAPVLLLGPWGGVVADRFDNRRAVLAVQSLLGLQAAALATVELAGVDAIWPLFALASLQGVGTAFDTPTRQSLVGQIVPAEALSNALALNAGLVQLARIIGPVAGAGLIAAFGPGVCFAVNALSYLVVVIAVRALDRDELVPRRRSSTGTVRIRDGFRYARSAPHVRVLLYLTPLLSTTGVSLTVVLPVLSKEAFSGGATMYGILAACAGLGALIGAAFLASRRFVSKAQLVVTFTLIAAGYFGIAVSPAPFVGAVFIVVAAFGSFCTGVTLNSSIQVGARDDMRGRMISLYFLTLFGTNALAAPFYGWFVDVAGPRSAFVMAGSLALLTAARLGIVWRNHLSEPPSEPDRSE